MQHSLIPEVKDCRAPMISALQVCLSDQGDEDLETIDSAIDGALDFMCFKGGERIASIDILSLWFSLFHLHVSFHLENNHYSFRI